MRLLCAIAILLLIGSAEEEVSTMLDSVQWLGHAGIRITGEKVVYIDPYDIKGGDAADLILVTHDHFDHYSPDDIAKIRGEQTILVVPSSMEIEAEGRVERLSPGDSTNIEGIRIRAVPAYNPHKRFHPREKGYVGYVFTMEGITYYHAGDTDLIPEMEEIDADVAFLPIGGTYTMDAAEAARAAALIGPRVAVPIHWGKIVGAAPDAEAFRKACACEVRILPLP